LGVSEDPAANADSEAKLRQQMEATRQGFLDAMDDDFNSAGGLGQLFDLVRAINQAGDDGAGSSLIQSAQDILRQLMAVLGLRPERPAAEQGALAAPFIDLLVQVRRELRQQKLWALSDQVRNRLSELKVALEDTKEGTTWKWK